MYFEINKKEYMYKKNLYRWIGLGIDVQNDFKQTKILHLIYLNVLV